MLHKKNLYSEGSCIWGLRPCVRGRSGGSRLGKDNGREAAGGPHLSNQSPWGFVRLKMVVLAWTESAILSYDIKRSPLRHLSEWKYGVIDFNKGAPKSIKSRPGNCCPQDLIDRIVISSLTSRKLWLRCSVTWSPKSGRVNVYYKQVIKSKARS